MTTARFPITWKLRNQPLAPEAVLATGGAARRLVRSLLTREPESLKSIAGVHAADAVFFAGVDLPWSDGAVYLAKSPNAASLYLSTTYTPNVPADWLEQAVRTRFNLTGPFAIDSASNTILSLANLRPLDRQSLERWLDSPRDAKEPAA